MFIPDKKYPGWKANQMVSHMVESYKKTIRKMEQEMRDSRFDVDQLQEQLRNQSEMLRDYEATIEQLQKDIRNRLNHNHEVRQLNGRIEHLRQRNESLEQGLREANEKFERSERICKNSVHGYEIVSKQLDEAHQALSKRKKQYDHLLGRYNVQSDNYSAICKELREREDQVDRLLKKICQFHSKKAENDAHWADSVDLTYFDVSSSVRVLFKLCIDVDGKEYIDARKYYNGQPTRKGICLLVEDFQEFLNGGDEAIRIRRRKYAGKGHGKGRQRRF